jgi:hypothetical protein
MFTPADNFPVLVPKKYLKRGTNVGTFNGLSRLRSTTKKLITYPSLLSENASRRNIKAAIQAVHSEMTKCSSAHLPGTCSVILFI